MIYIHTDGVKYSDDKKTLVSCPEDATQVTILEGVTSISSIDGDAFRRCSGLTSLVIPESVTSIGYGAFWGCSGLTSIKVDGNNPKYDSRNNCNAIIETEINTLIVGLQNTIIPDSVTSIGGWAFWGCFGLTSLVIPESVTSIGYGAFWGCSGLTSLVIPEGVTSIGDSAFSGCSGLEEIRIPKGTIEKFSKMEGLKNYSDLLVEYEEEIKEDANDKKEEVKEDFTDKKEEIPEEYVAPESEELTILVNLAKAYELGIGVEKDRNKAMQYYKQAAEKGSIIAAKKMAEIYQAESEKWRMKANGLKK